MKLIKHLLRQRRKDSSASVAKERLHIVVAHQRSEMASKGPAYMDELRNELLVVIRKYIEVSDDAIQLSLDNEDNCSVLEMNVTLPEPAR